MELNLIDMISEKHQHLRRLSAQRWQEACGEPISRTEEHLLNRVSREELSLSEAARRTDLSRQALHKCAVRLEERGYLTIYEKEGNRRDKFLDLTEKGRVYCRDSEALKVQMEREIETKIGKNGLIFLRKLLTQEWF